jgi:hypothetical protein
MRKTSTLLLFLALPFAGAQSKVERVNSVRQVTAQFCSKYAALYEFLGQTCRQYVAVLVGQDPQGATDFLVTLNYTDSSGATLSASQLIQVTEPFNSSHAVWPPTAKFYFDDIVWTKVTIESVPSGALAYLYPKP